MHDDTEPSLAPTKLGAAFRIVGTLAVLVAIPAALAVFVGWPLPRQLPAVVELRRAWTQQDIPEPTIVKALAVVVWAAWAQLVWVILTEAAAVVGGRTPRHVLALPGVGHLGRQAVASVVLLVSTMGPGRATASPMRPLAVVEVVADDVVVAQPSQRPSTVAPTERTHDVVRGDSLWSLAEHYLGDGFRWREVRDANVGRSVAPGRVLRPTDEQLDVGWRLVIRGEPRGSEPATPSAPDQAAIPASTTTARPGDDLWKLAEAHISLSLGRPPTEDETRAYWTEVVEANRRRLADRLNPSLIYAGQEIVLPARAASTPVDTSAPPTPPTSEPPALPAQPATEAPEPATSPGTPRGSVAAAPTPSTSGPSSTFRDTAPTTTTVLPAEEGSSDVPATGTTPHRAPSGGEPEAPGDTEPLDESADPRATGLVGAAGVALAVGVVRAVRRRRRRRSLRAPASVHIEEQGDPVHRDLLFAADGDAVDLLGRSLADLAAGVADAGLDCAPCVVQHGRDHIDVLLDPPAAPAVGGWEDQGQGAIWSRDLSDPLPVTPSEFVQPAPLLVTLGQPDDGGQLYVNLEAAGVVSLVGDDDAAAGVARAMVTELAHSPLAETAQVLVVGDLGVASIAELDHVTVVDGWPAALPDIESWAKASRQAFDLRGWPNPFVARGHDEYEDVLAPLLVVADHPPANPSALAILSDGPATVAAVVVGDHGAATSMAIDCSEQELVVPGLGLTCRPQILGRDDIEAVVDILQDAGGWDEEQLAFLLEEPADDYDPDVIPTDDPTPHDLDVVAPDPPEPAYPSEPEPDSAVTEPPPVDPASVSVPSGRPDRLDRVDLPGSGPEPEEPHAEVVVRLLGDIAVEGARAPLSGKQTAIVAYIAAHGGVTGDRLEDAIWLHPTSGRRRRRLINTMSAIRAALGGDHLPPAAAGRYDVGPRVVTDLELFDRRCEAARGSDPAAAAQALAEAFSLVTGKIFNYPSADSTFYTWVDLENWVSTWEIKVATVAEDLVARHVGLGDPAAAVDVAERALRIIPAHAGCTEALMRAHAANGERTAVRRVYEAHLAVLEQLDLEPAAESTAELYADILRERP